MFFHPMSGYGYLASQPLPLYNYPIECVETKDEDMSDFRSKGTLVPEFQSEFCTSLKDDIGAG